jgi:hypothetical protein
MPARHAARGTKWLEVALALAVLWIGSLVYVLDRPADSTVFFSAVILGQKLPNLFGWIGNSLPAFAHTFSFCILTSVWLGRSRRVCIAACSIWLGIDCAFEIGQHAPIAAYLVRFIPRWFKDVPILEYTEAYFASGTFDAWDLIFIAAGAIAALLVAAFPITGTFDHE